QDSPKGPTVQDMEDIRVQADRCHRIVANLLQFARRQSPHLEAIRINEVVEPILQLREYELAARNVKLLREYDPSNPLICADPNKIQQIALNLLNNAHDAIAESGRPGKIWVRTSTNGGKVILEFLDNGTGLRDPERVFEPFYTTKEAGKGTGLGLSVCYGIVQEHHGQIRAANWENGAHLTVILPIGDPRALQAKQKPAAIAESVPEPAMQPQALVVDDEQMLLRLQISYLLKMGIQGVGVSTGEEAVQYLKQNAVDVVISDLRMPGAIDGIQLFHWVRVNRPTLQKRFLLVSGALMKVEGVCESQEEEESVPRLQKPFGFEDYSRSIRQVLQN
ncbi:MAG TPA: ATP-binding protein, partial [Acidobacteriota bacterium]|nr:ATP-binding protein [Acidobacteriota bacterium]